MTNELEQTYLNFLQYILDHGVKKKIVQELVQLVYLVIKCDLIYQKASAVYNKAYTVSLNC